MVSVLTWLTVIGLSVAFQVQQDAVNATHIAVYVLSPLVLAVVRRGNWGSDFMAVLAFVTVLLLYTAGAWLDQRLAWPLTGDFWTGLLTAYGVQQGTYNILEVTKVLPRIEYST